MGNPSLQFAGIHQQGLSREYEWGAVPSGYTFRVFGRNLCLPGAAPSVTFVSGGISYPVLDGTNY